MAARRMWKMWNRNQEIWKQMVSKRVFLVLPELWTNMYCVSFYSVSSCIPHTLRRAYINTSYLRACIPQYKHKRQHLSSGHWRKLQSYRTKDCQSHNELLKSHITVDHNSASESRPNFSIKISIKLQLENLHQTSASKSWLSLSLKISTKPQ